MWSYRTISSLCLIWSGQNARAALSLTYIILYENNNANLVILFLTITIIILMQLKID